MKISDIQKRKMLEDVLIRNKSLSETVKENGYSRRALERLLARARVHGIENVLHENAQRRYQETSNIRSLNMFWMDIRLIGPLLNSTWITMLYGHGF